MLYTCYNYCVKIRQVMFDNACLKRFFQAEKVLYIQVFQNKIDHRMLISWIVFF